MEGTGVNIPLPLSPPPHNKFLVMALSSARRYRTTVLYTATKRNEVLLRHKFCKQIFRGAIMVQRNIVTMRVNWMIFDGEPSNGIHLLEKVSLS